MWNDTIIEAVRRTGGAELELTELGLGRHSVATVDDRKRTIAALIRGLKYAPTTERSALVERIQEKAGQSLPNDLMMSAEQVRSLRRAGMEIGGHTVSHPILARLDARDARAEIAAGKDRIEQLLGERISLFAYPNGRPQEDFTAEHVWLVRQLGFDAAVTTAWGAADGRSDLFQLPRFTPWDRTPIRFVARMMRSALRGRARTAEPARDRRPTQDA
jgi:peptidoglycan/xylan/chitin deacetylase (PgdA/CDA1 family)